MTTSHTIKQLQPELQMEISIEVISGLKAGDKIVTLGMNNLKDGTVVVISNK